MKKIIVLIILSIIIWLLTLWPWTMYWRMMTWVWSWIEAISEIPEWYYEKILRKKYKEEIYIDWKLYITTIWRKPNWFDYQNTKSYTRKIYWLNWKINFIYVKNWDNTTKTYYYSNWKIKMTEKWPDKDWINRNIKYNKNWKIIELEENWSFINIKK